MNGVVSQLKPPLDSVSVVVVSILRDRGREGAAFRKTGSSTTTAFLFLFEHLACFVAFFKQGLGVEKGNVYIQLKQTPKGGMPNLNNY